MTTYTYTSNATRFTTNTNEEMQLSKRALCSTISPNFSGLIMPSSMSTDKKIFHQKRKRSKFDDKCEKKCSVCGDAAKSMHFGGMACDSCKAFFRRSVQSNNYESFICSGQKNCPVIKDNRRICQYCR